MPSSLIFAALAAAWLVILVPMFARRRQEVARTADSALAGRVVRRGRDRAPVTENAQARNSQADGLEEAFAVPDTDLDRGDLDRAPGTETFDYADPGDLDDEFECTEDDDPRTADGWRPVRSEDVRAGRRYRPGRGGFDPEAAARAARAKYGRRQRIVLTMLAAAVITAIAGLVVPAAWWAHGAIDLTLASYLTYLRRQVRIEEDVRHRRLARITDPRDQDEPGDEHEYEYATDEYGDEYRADEFDGDGEFDQDDLDADGLDHAEHETAEARREDTDGRSRDRRRATEPVPHRNAVVVELDDEDPAFDELDERTWDPYRRAVGE